ncbi:uncharacterized protein LOC121986915 [Zingiber officinale]|uniref:uncharacterized protein LOC121986915 n=1 Tax=Zingiber officinale TaxID=94328 RepID=UPI001C4D803A|nr:uncharacterized protein LOC121986915 [Zingiber officinale]
MAAKATTVADFRQRMDKMKRMDEKAYDWLSKKPVEHWSKSHFTIAAKCDVLLNNMCECFNSLILDAREKPIIPMFENIRSLLMVRFQLNRDKAEKWDKGICPKIINVLAKIYIEAAQHSPLQADSMHFQIHGPSGQHTVNFSTNSCSCRKWDLIGIPCPHAVCALWCKHQDPLQYVSPYYTVEAYKRCYENAILPITGPDLWPKCELSPPLPPMYTKKVDRPAKLRRRERDEVPSGTHLRGAKRNTKCRKCGRDGHNKRMCKEIRESVNEPPTQQSQSSATTTSKPQRKKALGN